MNKKNKRGNKNKKQKIMWKSKEEMIKWNIVNSLLAGGFVFFGAIADGSVTRVELLASLFSSLLVALTKFKDFWSKQKDGFKLNNFATFIQ